MRSLLIAMLLIPFLCFSAFADEAEEEKAVSWMSPYTGLTVDRPSGPDEWSTGWLFGMEMATDPVKLALTYQLHDIHSNKELYRWNSTFEIEAGFSTGYRFLGLVTAPHWGFTLSRPSDPGNWSFGTRVGAEIEFDPFFLDLSYQLTDVWTETDVYPWDGTTRLLAGTYF